MASSIPPLFDRALVRVRRDRAARMRPRAAADPDFLRKSVAAELLDRMMSVTRDFPAGVELGGGGAFARAWAGDRGARAKLGWLASADLSEARAAGAGVPAAVMDEERLALREASVDLVVSPLSLHWTNDLPGALIQIRRALTPDGLFLGALFGGATLGELRACLLAAEAEVAGGAAARVSPFADVLDGAQLLQRAGFALPVADRDVLTIEHADPIALMRELRAMGETAAFAERPLRGLRRDVLARAAELYAERYPGAEGRTRATFEIIHLAGWAPHPDQPRPKRPGSANVRLADALGVPERSAGERAGRGPPRGSSED